jgi:xanthine/CO dehydrogenase XdhC/CoxF family maturation factor
MKELLEILTAYRQSETPMALATIVQTAGSSYRRAGARMLILDEYRTVGCISGGCLDQDVVLHGLSVVKNQKPTLISYDTASDRDSVFGVGVGCNGVIDILLEYLPPRIATEETGAGLLGFLDDLYQRGGRGATATVIRSGGDLGLKLGDFVALNDGPTYGTNLGDPRLIEMLARHAEVAMANCRSGMIFYEAPEGSVQIFAEPFLPQRRLVIFGAGHDAMPLTRIASELGYKVFVVDGRAAYLTPGRFPMADELMVARPEDGCPPGLFDSRTSAVIMSHNYLVDRAWLKNLLPLGLPYLGLMGPRKRADRMFHELQQEGTVIREEDLYSVHNPIGLDIGGETPGEIALAIVAELQAALTGRDGGKLRLKKGAIHLAPGPSSAGDQQPGLSRDEGICAVSA